MTKIRYGVIGIKGMGKWHLHFARPHPQVELSAVVDIDAPAVKTVSQELNIQGFLNYQDMLRAGLVDAVSIATPHYLLPEIALDCLQAGVHVLVEKPFALRVSQADALVQAAKKHQVKLAVNFQYRTHRSSQALKNLIETGTIGNPTRLLWSWGEFRTNGYYTRDDWRATYRHAGGGILMSHAHDLDLIQWLCGPPQQVSAIIGNQLHDAEVEDIACVNVLFTNGAMGSLQFTLNHPRGYSTRQIEGDRGMILMPDVKSLTNDQDDQILLGTYGGSLREFVYQLPNPHDQPEIAWQPIHLQGLNGHKPPPVSISTSKRIVRGILRRVGLARTNSSKKTPGPRVPLPGFPTILDNFIESIYKNTDPIVNGESARSTVELINGIILSALRCKHVTFPVDRDEYDQLFEELTAGKVTIPRLGQCSATSTLCKGS
jgi:predicted dehydrogenase